MKPRINRTIICSVVFLDIADYSRKPVAEQIRLKERLNDTLSVALADVAANDRIILDTGDGAAISFLGDPEDALFVALSLRDALAAAPPAVGPELRTRIGINLGPVKLITDLNGQANIIGDGINVAQRVMSFAEPGQALVSRSYYEVVSRLSEDYVKLFNYQGARTDKHVREHEVYAVGASQPGIKRTAAAAPEKSRHGRMAVPRAMVGHLVRTAARVQDNLRRRPQLSTALAVALILATSVAIRISLETRDTAVQSAELSVAAPEPTAPPAGATAAPAATAAPPATAAPAATAAPPASEAPAKAVPRTSPSKAPPRIAAPARKEPPPVVAAPEPALVAPAPVVPEPAILPAPETAKVRFAISPWGEIFVNGRKAGVAPPLRDLQVEPGRHKIEVRNSDFPAYVQTINAKAGEQIRIRHKFR